MSIYLSIRITRPELPTDWAINYYERYIVAQHPKPGNVHYHIHGEILSARVDALRKFLRSKFSLNGNKDWSSKQGDALGYQYILHDGSVYVTSHDFSDADIAELQTKSIQYKEALRKGSKGNIYDQLFADLGHTDLTPVKEASKMQGLDVYATSLKRFIREQVIRWLLSNDRGDAFWQVNKYTARLCFDIVKSLDDIEMEDKAFILSAIAPQ